MDDTLDAIWFRIVDFFHYLSGLLDTVFSLLDPLGPAVAIFVIAALTFAATRVLSRFCKTKRYRDLEKQFVHLYRLREEAMKWEDNEKGRRLARNIDQGELNQVYYNYFFEGFMLSLATRYLPIFMMMAYVNEAYKADNLVRRFGRPYVFRLTGFGEAPIPVSGVFWFIVSIVLCYAAWFFIKRIYARRASRRDRAVGEETPSR